MKAKKNANKAHSYGILPKKSAPNFNKPLGFDGEPLFDPDDNLYGSPLPESVSWVYPASLNENADGFEYDGDDYPNGKA